MDRQRKVLVESGIAADAVFDELTPWTGRRAVLTMLLTTVRPGDSVTVVGLHRLGHSDAEIADRVADFRARGVFVRALTDTSDETLIPISFNRGPTHPLAVQPAADAGPIAAPFGRTRPIGRPAALDASKTAAARRMLAGGMSKTAVAKALGVSRPTLYKALAASEYRG
ncbi:hypothetical protein BHQ18_02005 [Mycolicibacterium flavescens]|uniref:Uncharacterized protein n=1 Tax=Mycolicibacterium flavescens TaxID=1776 RepID=A0A1E3RRJ8_MYCFV|nr:hypothetical protein BHQ18_02005 [Mycolicibacterium flavescens]